MMEIGIPGVGDTMEIRPPPGNSGMVNSVTLTQYNISLNPARLCRIIIIIAVFLMQTIVSLGGCINTLAVCEV